MSPLHSAALRRSAKASMDPAQASLGIEAILGEQVVMGKAAEQGVWYLVLSLL